MNTLRFLIDTFNPPGNNQRIKKISMISAGIFSILGTSLYDISTASANEVNQSDKQSYEISLKGQIDKNINIRDSKDHTKITGKIKQSNIKKIITNGKTYDLDLGNGITGQYIEIIVENNDGTQSKGLIQKGITQKVQNTKLKDESGKTLIDTQKITQITISDNDKNHAEEKNIISGNEKKEENTKLQPKTINEPQPKEEIANDNNAENTYNEKPIIKIVDNKPIDNSEGIDSFTQEYKINNLNLSLGNAYKVIDDLPNFAQTEIKSELKGIITGLKDSKNMKNSIISLRKKYNIALNINEKNIQSALNDIMLRIAYIKRIGKIGEIMNGIGSIDPVDMISSKDEYNSSIDLAWKKLEKNNKKYAMILGEINDDGFKSEIRSIINKGFNYGDPLAFFNMVNGYYTYEHDLISRKPKTELTSAIGDVIDSLFMIKAQSKVYDISGKQLVEMIDKNGGPEKFASLLGLNNSISIGYDRKALNVNDTYQDTAIEKFESLDEEKQRKLITLIGSKEKVINFAIENLIRECNGFRYCTNKIPASRHKFSQRKHVYFGPINANYEYISHTGKNVFNLNELFDSIYGYTLENFFGNGALSQFNGHENKVNIAIESIIYGPNSTKKRATEFADEIKPGSVHGHYINVHYRKVNELMRLGIYKPLRHDEIKVIKYTKKPAKEKDQIANQSNAAITQITRNTEKEISTIESPKKSKKISLKKALQRLKDEMMKLFA